MKFRIFLALGISLFGSYDFSAAAVAGSVQPLHLSSDDKVPNVRWPYLRPPQLSLKGSAKLLAELKMAQIDGKWETCLSLAGRAKREAKSLLPWILIVELDCARQIRGTVSSTARLERAIQEAEKLKSELLIGPTTTLLRKNLTLAYLALLEDDIRINRLRAWASVDRLITLRDWLDENGRAQVYRNAGELSFIQQKLEASRDYFRRSLAEVDSEAVRVRLNAIEKGIGKKSADEPVASPTPSPVDLNLESKPEERALAKRITDALKSADVVPAMEDCARLIKEFPGGTRARWAADRMLETLQAVIDKGDAKLVLLRDRILKEMERVDDERLVEWCGNLYDRGAYEESFRLCRAGIEKAQVSARTVKLYELGAKSALAIERTSPAREWLQVLMDQFAGSAQSREAMFRLGLLYFRGGDYSNATSTFERLLVLPQIDRFELSARYWLWQALKKQKLERASQVQKDLITRFPFSYYGLRARAEQKNGLVEFDLAKSARTVSTMWLLPFERQSWERAQILLQAGWLEEAQLELAQLPAPLDADDKAQRALVLAGAMQYMQAIKLVNEAWDENPIFRRDPYLAVAYPREFKVFVDKEGAARGLHPYLVWSLIKQESSFSPRAVSRSQALGLMQVIPPTAREIAGELKLGDLSLPEEMFNVARNIQMGTYYLGKMINRFSGHVPLGLAAYNAGPTRMDRWLKGRTSLQKLSASKSSRVEDEIWIDELPWGETSFYVKAILRNWILYQTLEQGRVALLEPVWVNAVNKSTPD